jgi:hypothetical protein
MESVLNPRLLAGGAEYLCRGYLRPALDTTQQIAKPYLLCFSSRQLSHWQCSDSRTSLNSGLDSFKQA